MRASAQGMQATTRETCAGPCQMWILPGDDAVRVTEAGVSRWWHVTCHARAIVTACEAINEHVWTLQGLGMRASAVIPPVIMEPVAVEIAEVGR